MPPETKLTLVVAEEDLARTICSTLQYLVQPAPAAVTLFDEGADGWRVEGYYAKALDTAALTESLESALERPAPPLNFISVPNLNWVALSQSALPPVTAGRFIVCGSHDRDNIPKGRNTIIIDAGEAFGTAHHASTVGCLLAIDRLARAKPFYRVLDLGCGSGVLAIAAARVFRNAHVFAADIDAKAVSVAERNVRANGVDARIAIARSDGLDHHALRHAAPFDLITANILTGPLCTLAPDIAKAATRGGVLVLSGMLVPEAAAVSAAYLAQGFALKEHRRIEGWSTLTLGKRG